MNAKTTIFILCVLWAALAVLHAGGSEPVPQTNQLHWYKGNTHTHTLNSDGDSTPDDVVRWYREHGYHFLVLTDHNFRTTVEGLNAIHGADEKFLALRGEEVSDQFEGKPLHVNAIGAERLISAQGGDSVPEVLQRIVTAIRGARGVPQINHPNYKWAITADELKKVKDCRILEIHNGHPRVNNAGGGGSPGVEALWDELLSSGQLVYGVASDDAHHFKRPWDLDASKPGQGWIYVRAAQLNPMEIVSALDRGDFYSSTGVELSDYQATPRKVTVAIREIPASKYRVQFIGRNGRILAEATKNPAVYEIQGDEGYVRAKVIESNGKCAWTQPLKVGLETPK